MNFHEIDPLTDERWEGFLDRHPQASIFHTRGWLEALHRTYGYAPLAFTTCCPGSPLTNGTPFCEVTGWLGKRRLVALPFSDHCVPLVDRPEQLVGLLEHLRDRAASEHLDYVQVRANEATASGADVGEKAALALHILDLQPPLESIFQSFHANCVQRKIRRAEREGLSYQEGRSESLLKSFYRLLLVTRRRHGVPPQPYQWFLNLIASLADRVKIRVAYKDGRAIASILTLHYKQTMTYKYGCSDPGFSALGGMQLLMWSAIHAAKIQDATTFDMGRSDSENSGLLLFKDRWGASQTPLRYFQYPLPRQNRKVHSLQLKLVKSICSMAPDRLLAAAGKALYRYAG
jgi:hypothetical protein